MSRSTTAGAIGLGVVGAGAATYTVRQQMWARVLGLRSAEFTVTVNRDLRFLMSDGAALATDIYRSNSETAQPTILIRTPYGRSGTLGTLEIYAQRFAERGYNVVLKDVRGRFDSDGDFVPYQHEAADGNQTVEWIVEQHWSDGQIATWGQSYLDYAQWALASTKTPRLKAMMPMITQSHLGGQPEHGVLLDQPLCWLYLINALDSNDMPMLDKVRRLLEMRNMDTKLALGFETLPLYAADETVVGSPVPFFREWVENAAPDSPYWAAVDFRSSVADVNIPTHHLGGWHDIFITGQLADYHAQLAAGHNPYLTIGPWTHIAPAVRAEGVKLALNLFDTHLKGKEGVLREKPVRIFVMGADEWREYDQWPPATPLTPLFLHADHLLSEQRAGEQLPDCYLYDPSDPTPSVGGALLGAGAGSQDNRELEARSNVLSFTLAVLENAVEIIGTPTVKLYVQSSVEWTEFFGRITDVHPDGRSMNVTDSIFSITPTTGERQLDGTICIDITLAPTAYRFKAGHSIRLQISSGAYPRFARNLGTGEPLTVATKMVMADQTIYHDAQHPSALLLPIV